MIKTLQLSFWVSILAACHHLPATDLTPRLPNNSHPVTLKLVDSLGEATFFVPMRYDASFSWTHYSDCGKSCDKIKYRYQPATLKVVKESGWAWFGDLKDSVERFTIVHSGYFPFYNRTDSNITMVDHLNKKGGILSDPGTYKIKSDTIEKINDRFFSIVVIDLYDSTKQLFTKKVLSETTIKGNIVEFNYELLTKQKDSVTENFITNSKELLRTIHLSKGM
jgi:hypothetical protein